MLLMTTSTYDNFDRNVIFIFFELDYISILGDFIFCQINLLENVT